MKKEFSSVEKRRKRWKIIFASVFLLAIFLVAGFAFAFYKTLTPQGESAEIVHDVTIASGQSISEITAMLYEKNVIKNPGLFQYAFFASGKAGNIQAGNYEIKGDVSISELIQILSGGEVVLEGSVTVPEGLTAEETADVFAEYFVEHQTEALASDADFASYKERFMNEVKDIEKYRAEYSFLEDVPERGTLEGYLFPDTYRVFKQTEPDVVIKKMLDNFAKKFTQDFRVETISQGKSIHDIITLASIVEKEVSAQYMKDVAGIFYNRLAVGRKLESDATVNYVLDSNNPQPTFNDVAVDSPYNTYQNVGLPPGPISNPGAVAIEATIFPNENDYFFFLTRLDTGQAIFSKTGAEHLKNKEIHLP